MNISKQDALNWFRFFAALPEEEELPPRQMEIALAALYQIERTVNARFDALLRQIPHLKSLDGRTYYVGDEEKFPRGCRSCLLGTGLSAVRKTNRCNAQCKFCYDYGMLDQVPPIGEGLWEIGGTKFYEDDLPLLMKIREGGFMQADSTLSKDFFDVLDQYERRFREAAKRTTLPDEPDMARIAAFVEHVNRMSL